MAGDWIKMRNNLWDDPRISQLCDMTDALEATVIGGLYWLWSAADEHTEDGFMPGLSTTGIDRKTGVKGLGAALVSIGWIKDSDIGITILRFDEHNGASAKRRSADAQRKANSRNVSASDADNLQTDRGQNAPSGGAQEEKNREEKRRTKSKSKEYAQPTVVLPDWIPQSSWSGYLDMRNAKNKNPTARAIELLIGTLEKMKSAGQDIAAVLDRSTINGWTDVYAIKPEPNMRPASTAPPSANSQLGVHGQATANAAKKWLEESNAS
jgi:hypothetical protein